MVHDILRHAELVRQAHIHLLINTSVGSTHEFKMKHSSPVVCDKHDIVQYTYTGVGTYIHGLNMRERVIAAWQARSKG